MKTTTWVAFCLLLVTFRTPAAEPARVALVIGNGAYSGAVWSDLGGGPQLDARSMRAVLQNQLHFQVVYREDADLKHMNEALDEFRAQLRSSPGAVALVFYSGHGGQAPAPGGGGELENYLIPARTELKDEADAQYLAIGQGRLENLIREANARAGVLILDACRDHIALAGGRAARAKGLRVEASTNVLVLYAAASGKSAYNPPPGRTSEFTTVLAEEIVRPGSLGDMVYRIRSRVIDLTKKRGLGPQEPEQLNKLNEPLELVPLIPPQPLQQQSDRELALWQGAQHNDTADAYRDYLKHYPEGLFSAQAKLRIAALTPAAPDHTGATRPAEASRAAGPTTQESTAARDCDRLTAGAFEKIDGKAAQEACERAVREFPGEAKLKAYLGNALYRLGKLDDAVVVFRQAADQGSVYAQSFLGFMYAKGYGVPQDHTEALKWYRLAAEGGDASAQDNLGTVLVLGRGVTQDYTEALKWYRLAADQGLAHSQFDLGFMYENGHGIPKDRTEAVKLYREAAKQGDESAKTALQRLGEAIP
jgi:tetratricopeptide (TPR) repeat protein